MKKYYVGILIGCVLGFFLSAPVTMLVAKDKYKFGYGVGQLDGQSDVMRFLSKHFKKHPEGLPLNPKDELRLKSGNIFVVEKNGQTTLEIK